ncbi:acyltransferase family protein [Rhodoplanes sp. SY1]|uniref:acyltransferase family protein n=1 Tax=Rhodoplanes sp. SY1 TaxID=3166646 RepID=UPI0038B62A65
MNANLPPAVPPHARQDYIDSLRGVAAVMVVYYHMSGHLVASGSLAENGIESYIFRFIREWIDLGKIGVAVFFAVSGFVVPVTIMKRRGAPLRAFIINRFFRLYPVYWVSIFAAIPVLWWGVDRYVSFKVFIINVTMFQQFFGVENIQSLYWTLQIELIFYILCAFMYRFGLLQSRNVVVTCSYLFLFAAVGLSIMRNISGVKLPVAVLIALSLMFWGFTCRDWFLSCDRWSRLHGKLYAVVFLAVIPLISLLAYNSDYGFRE